MKNKLIAAMLLLTVQINGMEETPLEETPSHLREAVSCESQSIEENNSPQKRVDELDEYYQRESFIEGNNALQNLNKLFDEEDRKLFFEELVLEENDITNDAALLKFIRAAAWTIMNLPEYNGYNEASSDSFYSPDYIYKPPFLFTLVEALDPVTRNYMRRVAAN